MLIRRLVGKFRAEKWVAEDGHIFRIKRKYKTDAKSVYMTCANRNCRGSCVVFFPINFEDNPEAGQILHQAPHTRGIECRDLHYEEVNILRQIILKRAAIENTPNSVIFQEEISRAPVEVRNRISFKEIERSMQRSHQQGLNPPTPNLLGNRDLLGLSAKEFNKNKRNCQGSFVQNDIVQHGAAVSSTSMEPSLGSSLVQSCFDPGSAEENSEQQSQRTKGENGSEGSLDSFAEAANGSAEMDVENYYDPQTIFVPVVDIKEEPVETTENSNCLNIVSDELDIQPSQLMSGRHDTTVHFPVKECGNPSENRFLQKTEILVNHPPTLEDADIDPYTNQRSTSDVARAISGTDSDFTNLKNVIFKLEKISDKLAYAAVADQYEEFGKYLATLLRGIPIKKFLSLKQKFIDDVIQAKMALDEANNPSPVTENCEVPKPIEHPQSGNENYVNSRKRNKCKSTDFGKNIQSGNDSIISSKPNLVRKCARTSEVHQEVWSVIPTPIPSTSSPSVLLVDKEIPMMSASTPSNKRRRKSTSQQRLRKRLKEHVQEEAKPASIYTEERFQIEVEEGSDLKHKTLDFSEDIRTEQTCKTLASQEPEVMIQAGEESLLDTSVVNAKGGRTSQLSCDNVNLNLSTSSEMKRHYVATHPDMNLT